MARRRIGQEQMALGHFEAQGGTSLDEVAALIDWAALDPLLAGITASNKGEAGWPPLALFKALLLATWHDLSDVQLAAALDDRASFRRFCGFARHEPTPERTSFVRFRRELVRRGLDRSLFAAVTAQLEARGVVVRTGTLVDATLVASASVRRDGEARWAGHRRRKPVHGYKAHVATDQDAGLIRGVEVTTANVHDAAELDAILPAAAGPTYGDSAYAGTRSERIICAHGGTPQVVATGTGGGAEALARLQAHNAAVRRIRGRIEKVFGTCSAATACVGCAGWAWPRPGCRSGWRRWPTTCAEAGGCSGHPRRDRRQPNAVCREAARSKPERTGACFGPEASSTCPAVTEAALISAPQPIRAQVSLYQPALIFTDAPSRAGRG